MAHKHSVYDTDTHFLIDGETRAVKNASATKAMLVQHDHNSERFTFEVPRRVDDHDLSVCNSVQVHYINIDSTTKEQNVGVYEVDDLQVSPDGDDVVICSWLISGNATKHVGILSFVVRFSCLADDGSVDYVWNTAKHSNVHVTDGIYNGEYIIDEYVDILDQWREELEAKYSEVQTQVVEEMVSTALTHAVTAFDFSNLANGTFTETVNGEVIIHNVTFDESGRPIKIDNIEITWGDA